LLYDSNILLDVLMGVMVYPQPSTKNHTATRSLLPPRWDGEENWEKAAELMGWDRDSLTEQQRKSKTTI